MDEERLREFQVLDAPKLVAALTLISGNQEVAEDAVQEAVTRAWEASLNGLEIQSLPAWVRTVSLNCARSHFRHIGAERRGLQRLAARYEEANSVNDSEGAGRAVAETVDLIRALGKLSRREREVLSLRYRLGMSIGEIAAALGVHEGTVKTLLYRGRTKLRTLLDVPRPHHQEAHDERA